MGKDEYAIGAFKDGKFDGTMKLGLGEGDTFEGNYAENMKMGEGRYSWKDGTKYKGFWKDDVAIGTAVYTDPTTGNSENMIITS